MFGLWPRITLKFAEEFFLSLMSNWSRDPGLQKSCLNNCHLKIRSAFNNPNRIIKRKDYVILGFLRKLSVYYVDFSHAVVFLSLVTKNHRTPYKASQKEENKYHILRHICRIQKNDIDDLSWEAGIETQTQGTNVGIPRG